MIGLADATPGCSAPSCTAARAWQWQRYGTQAEYDAASGTPLQPLAGSTLKISVFACGAHALSTDAMTFTHQQTCVPWPTACTCAATDSAPTYTEPTSS